MEKVKKLIEAGSTIPGAIKECLGQNGLTVVAFAEKHGLNRSSAGMHINGTVRADDATIAALIAELGGVDSDWRELLWLAGKPESAAT